MKSVKKFSNKTSNKNSNKTSNKNKLRKFAKNNKNILTIYVNCEKDAKDLLYYSNKLNLKGLWQISNGSKRIACDFFK